ncbi:hypothetical protein [Sanguibacter sp. HDW7]|uniref:hypothetical protein n=1 Tax=Sanguibacter sp. HDW7 TaxID=2714931 RepID=UPI00140CEB26|nr:hypothetical protein [Sanguibacter sp. HDW7]QIK83727.1 hypothetical protein G7063_08880 [Sanguibacter sp. HDW7]
MDDEETCGRESDERAADVREGLTRLGLNAVGTTDGALPWTAVSADGAEHEVTVLTVGAASRWELLRTRTTALLGLEHENVVPLVGAMPVGDRAAPAPRTLVLVWLAASARRTGGPQVSDAGAGLPGARMLDVLVAACRGAVALRACGVSVPAAAVDALVADAARDPGADSPLQLHPWPWALEVARTRPAAAGDAGASAVPYDDEPYGDEPHDLTRGVAQRLVRHLERTGAGAPRAVRDLLAAATGTSAPAPGDLAMRALALRAAIDADPEGYPDVQARSEETLVDRPTVDRNPDVQAGPEASGSPVLTATTADWRAIVRDGEAFAVAPPPQARRTARGSARVSARPGVGPVGTRTSLAAPTPANSDLRRASSLPGRAASRPLPRSRTVRRPPRAAVTAGIVLVVVAGTAALLHLKGGRLGPQQPASAASVPTTSGAGTSASPTPGQDGPAEAARRATVGRVDVLAGLAPVPAEDLASTTASVEARLATIVGPGPVRDADLSLVSRVLRGEETPPRVRAEVSSVEVLAQDATAASVAVTYALVPGGSELHHTLRLTHADGAWKVVSVEVTDLVPTP